jgi:hypothetical protein
MSEGYTHASRQDGRLLVARLFNLRVLYALRPGRTPAPGSQWPPTDNPNAPSPHRTKATPARRKRCDGVWGSHFHVRPSRWWQSQLVCQPELVCGRRLWTPPCSAALLQRPPTEAKSTSSGSCDRDCRDGFPMPSTIWMGGWRGLSGRASAGGSALGTRAAT